MGNGSFPKLKKLPKTHAYITSNMKIKDLLEVSLWLRTSLIPNAVITISLTSSTQALGKYGRMRRIFLEQNKPILFNDMILNETPFLHLWEVQQTCEKRMELLMEELLANNPAPDKATQQLVWVAHMNSLKAQAEESVLRELVYEEDIV